MRESLDPFETTSPSAERFADAARRLQANVATVAQVPSVVLRNVVVALLAEGHVLIEDQPGVGKTTLARALARSIDCHFARIQCTSDLLPADVVGASVYNDRERTFEFRPGPVFANVVLVDEINRASPKTQSGLLECMQERRVTVDVHTHQLARPFIVLATQNPIEYEGTYPLPEAQVDRFMVRVSIGYPDRGAEATMLAEHEGGDRLAALTPVIGTAELLEAQDAVRAVHTSGALRDYVVSLLWRTRDDPRVELGASPRAGLMLLQAAKALALVKGRDHALPDDVQEMAVPVLSHRLVIAPEAARRERSRGDRRCDLRGPSALNGPGSSLRGGATVVAVGGALTLAALALGAVPLIVPASGSCCSASPCRCGSRWRPPARRSHAS